MENLAHSASLQACEKTAPSKPGIKQEIVYRAGGLDQLAEFDGRHLLAYIINHADALDIATDEDDTRWLLVPMPPKLMLLLERYGADREDFEDGNDAEDDGISEPSLGAREAVAQSQWAVGRCDHEVDLEGGDHAA